MPGLLCDRPHERSVNFAFARFVVGREAGLDIEVAEGLRHLEMGEEVPAGAFDERVLRQLYNVPVPHPIEVLEYAMTVPEIREARARIEAAPVEEEEEQREGAEADDELDKLSRKQLADLCNRMGLKVDGGKQTLRERVAAKLARGGDRGGRRVG